MKLSASTQSVLLDCICYLYVLLFVYAAVSKLLDFENFQVQLGQSPLLSSFAGPVSYMVPGIEFIIVFMLLTVRFRYAGLYAAFSLMVMFTTYIFIMLHFSPFVPCSCGGILEKMSWNEHLLFNIIFTILALIAVLISKSEIKKGEINILKIRFVSTIISAVLSILFVVGLFVLSEDTIHHRNNFTRRFPKHPTKSKHEVVLPFNSYYIAGYSNGIVYLGNRTAPLTVTKVDTSSGKIQSSIIHLSKNDFPYSSPRLIVRASRFFFIDGTVPCVFSGKTSDWKAKLLLKEKAYFTLFEPVSDGMAIIRGTSSKTKESVLASINLADSLPIKIHHDILVKQIDGIFDTDGMLIYNQQLDKIIYTYYYRNEFIVADHSLEKKTSSHTIDTTRYAKLEVATVHSRKITTLAKQPKIVNKKTASFGKYLFVNAASVGQFESEQMWNKASIIDVYDLIKNTYAFSFYIYDKRGEKMSEFIVSDDLVVSLNGKLLTIEKLDTGYYESWNKHNQGSK